METHLSKTVQLAREAGGDDWGLFKDFMPEIEHLVALVRADERNSWPAEMEAMERQVNILTDALAAEREACARIVEESSLPDSYSEACLPEIAADIRERENT
jgi:hypothetical protein